MEKQAVTAVLEIHEVKVSDTIEDLRVFFIKSSVEIWILRHDEPQVLKGESLCKAGCYYVSLPCLVEKKVLSSFAS